MTKRKPDPPQGSLDMPVLKALSLGPMPGFGIGRRIRQFAEDMLTVEEGTLYPALYRIKERGWIESEYGGDWSGAGAWRGGSSDAPGEGIPL